ncbi:hypothetical protein ACFC0M_19300 [Streptomyces sp. NPDC056149]|uniref:MmyB family transcriptional regulator n=1 Tax=Streptomyces sp. NPDC056149 TaxID=3345728 RepID=UPI0035D6096C
MPADVYNTRYDVLNARYDVLAANSAYQGVFPAVALARGPARNALWQLFTTPPCCSAVRNRDEEFPALVAQLRGAYGRHVGEPAWEALMSRLSGASTEFARLWATGDVAPHGRRVKVVQHASVGEIRLVSSSLAVDGAPETRIVVYTPADGESRRLTAVLRTVHYPLLGCPDHLRPASEIRAGLERTWERGANAPEEPPRGAVRHPTAPEPTAPVSLPPARRRRRAGGGAPVTLPPLREPGGSARGTHGTARQRRRSRLR